MELHKTEAGVIVYTCMPGYGGLVNAAAVRNFHRFMTLERNIGYIENGPSHFSLLAFNHNLHWGAALSYEEAGTCTHFYCQHSDVEPEPGFLETMLGEMERVGADVLSAVVPIKNDSGETSTAIDIPEADGWEGRKMTLEEIYKLPVTFSAADTQWPDRALLINTGCLLVDLRGGWAREQLPDSDELRLKFTIRDRIRATRNAEGQYCLNVQVDSEDWGFSRTLHQMGRAVYATTAVRVGHHGTAVYYNDPPLQKLLDSQNREESREAA